MKNVTMKQLKEFFAKDGYEIKKADVLLGGKTAYALIKIGTTIKQVVTKRDLVELYFAL
ncbi:hypothetical protein [Mergibacter septicus]|uniref:hypothetical protein n=1 Tax=Mergibacter septicus TaxID=221402 RepID=UPI00223EA0BA|nr:hypothetical protein [Mergibacter septicus]